MAVNKKVADLVTPQTFSNKTLDASCSVQSLLGTSTLASLPAAGSPGRLTWLTDDIRGLLVDTGTQWMPIGQHAVNIRTFGADPTGATDSKAAIQLAINTGYPVYIPFGIYRVDSQLSVSTAGQTVFGDGDDSIIRCGNPNFNLFHLPGPSNNITFRNLRLEGAATNTTSEQYAFMSVGSGFATTDVRIINVHVTGQDATKGFNKGILASQSCNRWFLFGNLFENLVGDTSNYGYGFHTDRSTHHRLIGNHFIGAVGRGRHALYLATGASYCVAALNLVENYPHSAITVYTFASQPVAEGNIIALNVVRAGGSSVIGEGAVSIHGNAKNNIITENQIFGFAGNGAVVDFENEGQVCHNNAIRGNQIVGCTQAGVRVVGANNTVVAGNTLIDNGQATPDTYAGIDLRSVGQAGTQTLTNTKVLGNTVIGTSHRTSLRIDSALPLPTGTVIKGNAFSAGSLSIVELNEAAGVQAEIDGTLFRYPTYGTTVQLTAPSEIETINEILVTNNTNFTIRRPEDIEIRPGKRVTVRVKNTSGGAIGTITWFGLTIGAAWTNPANATSRSITFICDTTGWREAYRTSADVSN